MLSAVYVYDFNQVEFTDGWTRLLDGVLHTGIQTEQQAIFAKLDLDSLFSFYYKYTFSFEWANTL